MTAIINPYYANNQASANTVGVYVDYSLTYINDISMPPEEPITVTEKYINPIISDTAKS